MSALLFATQLLNSVLPLLDAGMEAYNTIVKANDTLKAMQDEGREPSDAEWQELNDLVEILRAQRPDTTA